MLAAHLTMAPIGDCLLLLLLLVAIGGMPTIISAAASHAFASRNDNRLGFIDTQRVILKKKMKKENNGEESTEKAMEIECRWFLFGGLRERVH